MGRPGRATVSAGLLAATAMVLAGLPATPTAGVTFEGRNGRIAWSRDGDIFTIRSDGTGRRRLTENLRFETAQWSPAGDRLAVVQWPAVEGQRVRILVMRPDGQGRSVVARARFSVQSMAWSPDGKRIAFCDLDISRPDRSAPYPAAIKVVDLLAGTRARLTEFSERACGPSWSPEGDRLAYTAGDSADTDIFVMGSDGSDPHVVVDDPGRQLDVAWSPASETLAVETVRQHPGGRESTLVETVRTDGTGRTVLTEAPEGSADSEPVWSPDGMQLLFFRLSQEPYAVRVGVVGADGGDAELVTEAQDVWQADWSATSTWIVVARGGDLYLLRPDGSTETRLTGGKAYDASPDWQAR